MKKYSKPEYRDAFAFLKGRIEKDGKLNKGVAVNFVQDELHELLNSFLNGGFSRAGYVLYPLIKNVSGENKKRLARISFILKYVNKSRFSETISLVETSPLNDFDFASVLCGIFRNFHFDGKTGKSAEKGPVAAFDLLDYDQADRDYLKSIDELRIKSEKIIKKHALGFYIHGSIATNDYVKGWSDADTMLILKKEAFEKPNNLIELRDALYGLRRFYCEIDPLQHHGTMIITEFDLDYYPEVFLPIDALKRSKSLLEGDVPIRFRIRDSRVEAFSKFRWFCGYFQRLDEKKLKNPYDLKFALHLVTLFPALYLEAKGRFMYKKFSFGIAEKDFEPEEWKVIKYSERLRDEWKLEGKMPLLKTVSRFNPVLAYIAGSRYISLINGLKNKVDRNLIVSGVKVLSKKALKNIESP